MTEATSLSDVCPKKKARRYVLNQISETEERKLIGNACSPPSYKIQTEWDAINPFFKQLDLLLTIEMVRFLGVASLVLFLQIALVSAQNEDAHARTRIGSEDACASGSCE